MTHRTITLLTALLVSLLLPATTVAEDYPPTGPRLKSLADLVDFDIGYASRYNFREQANATLYEQIVKAEFNIVTPENSVKWENVHPDRNRYDFQDMDDLVTFAQQQNMVLHGHPLLWYNQNPAWLDTLAPAEVEAAMVDHIQTVVGRYKNSIAIWDVVNEGLEDTANGGGLRDNIWLQAMGEAYIVKAFEEARRADPDAILVYNDYDVGTLTQKSQEMYDRVSGWVAAGVPIDAVGLQMHVTANFTQYEEFSDNMQRYVDLGLDVYITEFDVKALSVEDYIPQADVYEGVLRRCLAEPRCQAFQIWGIDDLNSWQPFFDPLPFDDEFKIKPAYYGMQRALSTRVLNLEQGAELVGFSVEAGALRRTADEAWVSLPDVDLTPNFQRMTLRYAAATAGNTVELRAGSIGGAVLKSIELPATGTASSYAVVEAEFDSAGESPNLVVVANTDDAATSALSLDWIQFSAPTISLVGSGNGTGSGSGSVGWLTLGNLTLWALLVAGTRRRCRRGNSQSRSDS